MLKAADKYLIEAIHGGDRRAFETLFQMHYAPLCKYAMSIVHSEEIAEDIVSDFFVKLWEDPIVIKANTSLKGYIFRSIHNSCINYMTRHHKNFKGLDAETIDKLNKLIPRFQESDTIAWLNAEELSERLDDAVKTLPTECGRIFKMSRQEGLSHKEIAQQLKISKNTVKVQIFRALSKLREELKEYF